MNAVKFTLSGKNAFFKKPEVNTYYYFTFGQIHKVALLGMFGAILGYDGYAQKKWTKIKKGQSIVKEYPEFYEKLNKLHISIVPQNERGYIPKKVQLFNNSVGYASGEQGGNLIVKEQWLENPKWDIYVLIDCDKAEKLADNVRSKMNAFIYQFSCKAEFMEDEQIGELYYIENGEAYFDENDILRRELFEEGKDLFI